MILILLLLALTTPPTHEYHVSKTNVRFVAGREQVQVEMHLFVDDLELAMMDAGAPELHLGSENEAREAGRFLASYLEDHFSIDWNGAAIPATVLGYELEDDLHGIWIYLAAETTEPPRRVVIQNSVITEYYADQKNIVKLFVEESRLATLLLSRDRPAESWEK